MSDYDALLRAAKASHKNPWEYAFQRPDLTQVKALIKGGRDLNEAISGMPLLTWAVFHRRDDLLELLLKSGADPNWSPPRP